MSTKKFLIGLGATVALLAVTRKVLAMSVQQSALNKNVQAFLTLIKKYESRGGDYAILYGGQHFTDFSKHPNVRVPFVNPKTGRNDYSTAAGAYQINYPTWLMINAAVSLADFSPQSQDDAAVFLLKKCGALAKIQAGDLTGALKAASGTWASLPYTDSKQSHITVTMAQQTYTSAGGTIA